MSRAVLILTIVLAGIIPIWGCGQSSTGAVNGSLEARIVKLEKDFKTVEAARDAAVAKASDLEKKLKAETTRADSITKERDELSANLKARQSEKEQVQTQLDGFKKGLKDLLATMENPGSSSPSAATATLPASTLLSAPITPPTVMLPQMTAVR
jgi:hypothetical protein